MSYNNHGHPETAPPWHAFVLSLNPDMGVFGSILSAIGFCVGVPFGLFIGYLVFIRSQSRDVKDPLHRPLQELDTCSVLEILPEVPLWVKHPDFDRVDWMNKFLRDMWPYLDKAICGQIRSITKPIFEQYIGKYQIRSLEFGTLTLGTLPPIVHGLKAHETNENDLVFETAIRWAGNPNISLVLNFLSLRITVQLIDMQISAVPRVCLKPLVPAFPCFSGISVSLLEKPQVDFGLKFFRGDIMAIPLLYHYIQELLRTQICNLYLWPQTLDIPILDDSVGATNKPVGILHVKIIRAIKLLKMDILGASDPYVKLSLSGEKLPAKKTSVKMKNLNPEWNESFKVTVKDLQSQVLELHVHDWEKIGHHHNLGMQVVPLRSLLPHETKEFTLDLVKNQNLNDPHNKKMRGQLVVELTFNPFKEETERLSGPLEMSSENGSGVNLKRPSDHSSLNYQGGLLIVMVHSAQDVEGKHRSNPYAVILFGGERRKTKVVKKSRDPCWNEEFQYVLEEAPRREEIRIEVLSKRRRFAFQRKELLGYVDVHLGDVVFNGHINEKFDLVNSRNGIIHVDIKWQVT